MNLRLLLKIFLPIAILAIAVAGYQYLQSSKVERKKPALKEKVWQVETIHATAATLSPELVLYGEVESPELLKNAAPGNAVVASVKVRSGSLISKGQILVSLDNRDFTTELIEAQGDLQDLERQIEEQNIRHKNNQKILATEQDLLVFAEAEVSRMEKLKTQNLGTESTLNSAKTELGKRQLTVLARQFEIDNHPLQLRKFDTLRKQLQSRKEDAELKIARSTVVAPFDGIVNQVEVTAGDRVMNGQTMISLFPQNTLEVRAHIPLRYLDSIQAHLKSGNSLSAETVNKIPKQLLKFSRFAGQARSTGLDGFFLPQLSEIESNIRIGELLSIKLSLPYVENAYAIPFQAIYGNSRIYRLKEGRLEGIDVQTIGSKTDDRGKQRLIIQSNELQQDDQIVITHLPNAVTGLKVETVEQ